MKQFIVNIDLPGELTSDFVDLIPEQRKEIDRLFLEGKILFYSLAYDRSKLWVGIRADSKQEVWNILWSFPLIDYMKPEIHELAFHQSMRSTTIEVSLN